MKKLVATSPSLGLPRYARWATATSLLSRQTRGMRAAAAGCSAANRKSLAARQAVASQALYRSFRAGQPVVSRCVPVAAGIRLAARMVRSHHPPVSFVLGCAGEVGGLLVSPHTLMPRRAFPKPPALRAFASLFLLLSSRTMRSIPPPLWKDADDGIEPDAAGGPV